MKTEHGSVDPFINSKLMKIAYERNKAIVNGKKRILKLQAEFGKTLRFERILRNLSLRELARRVNISAMFLSDLEQGKRFASAKTLFKIMIQFRKTDN
jgi:predicted transcriptional regulator